MKYNIAVLIGAICYGILSTIVVKAYGHGYSLGEVVGSQLLVGCVLAWALAVAMSKRSRAGGQSDHTRIALTLKQRLTLMAAGMPSAITGLLYYESLKTISNALAIVLLFQFTWISVLLQAIGNRKRPNKLTLLTLAVLFGGTLLAAGIVEQSSASFDGQGVLLGLASALSYSLFIMLSGKAVPQASPTSRSAWMSTGGLLLVTVLFPPVYLFDGTFIGPLFGFGLLLGFFGAFLPPVLFTYGVPRIGGGMAGILGAAELPVAVLLSAVVLHEHVSTLQWLGVALVLVGVALPEFVNGVRRQRIAYQGAKSL